MTVAAEPVMGISRRWIILLWLAAGVLLVLGLGNPAVQRTQEARVLEVGRQMLDGPPRGWLIPMLDGQPRLEKPPLPYWMSAGMYKVLGVSEFAGRLPNVLIGGLCLGVTYLIARRLFNQRAALISAAVLGSSYFFLRFTRLAETDAPAMFFVAMATYGLLRAIQSQPTSLRWFHLFATGSGMAFMSKGGPALFPLILLVMVALVEKRPRLLWDFLRSGALITLLLIAAPWYFYAMYDLGFATFNKEFHRITSGENHGGVFLVYFPYLLLATAPWCIALVPAIVLGITRFRGDGRLRFTILWMASVFVPLCLIGNKQNHYLLPIVPAAAILVGWMLNTRLQRPLLPSLLTAGTVGLAIVIALSWIVPRMEKDNTRRIAERIRAVGPGPYAMVAEYPELPLEFSLRERIHTHTNMKELLEVACSGWIVIEPVQKNAAKTARPHPLVLKDSIDLKKWLYQVYRVEP